MIVLDAVDSFFLASPRADLVDSSLETNSLGWRRLLGDSNSDRTDPLDSNISSIGAPNPIGIARPPRGRLDATRARTTNPVVL